MKSSHIFLVLATIVIGLVACEKDREELVSPPVTQQPNHLPVNALVKQVKWSDNDHLTAIYDSQNRLTQWRSQWQIIENDPTLIRSIIYDFQYDAQSMLTRISYSGGFVTNIYYNNQLVEKAQELFPGGAVMNDFTFLYFNKRIIGIIRKAANLHGGVPTTYKYEFGYDQKSNLNEIREMVLLEKPVNGKPYQLLETTTYSDFDNEINTTHWLVQFPWMPQVRWQFNNPRRMTIKTEGGSTRTFTYYYTYNDQGLPVEKLESSDGFIKKSRLNY